MTFTLQQYRQQGAQEAGRFVKGTSTTGGSTTTMVVTALITSLAQSDLYQDWWLYLTGASAGDKVRVVTTGPSTTGTITVDRVFSSATAANTQPFELHGMARPFADDLTETFDWTTLINDGLKRCFVEVEFTHTPVANQTRHDLTTLNAWLTEPSWVRDVGVLQSGEDRDEVDPYSRRVRGHAEKLSNLVYLTHRGRAFNSTETIYVKAIKPAYYHCAATAGALGSQSGLALETDIAEPALEWVAFAALVELARRSSVPIAGDSRKVIAANEKRWADLYSYYTEKYTAGLPPLKFTEKLMVGVLGQHSRWR